MARKSLGDGTGAAQRAAMVRTSRSASRQPRRPASSSFDSCSSIAWWYCGSSQPFSTVLEQGIVEAGVDGCRGHPEPDADVAQRRDGFTFTLAGHPLDMHHPGRQELGRNAVLVGKAGRQHLLLDLPVQRDGDVPVWSVESHVDEGVLLRKSS